MKIDLRKLLSARADSIPLDGSIDLSDELFCGEKPFQHPIAYSGEIKNQSDILRLVADVRTVYVTPCARCLKSLDISLELQVDMVLLPDDGENEEADNIFLYEGDAIDPEEVLVSELLLNIDMVYLCSEDCKGLCPHCGADRNVTQCDCDKKQIDDRLAVLKALLK